MVQDFHKARTVVVAFKDILFVDSPHHDVINIGTTFFPGNSRHNTHPEAVYHLSGRLGNKKGKNGTKRSVPPFHGEKIL